MKKIVFILMLLTFCTLQSCNENSDSLTYLFFKIEIVDMEGNDLLDPSFDGNIVSNTPTMINIFGYEVRSTIYTDESFLYNQGKGFLIIDRWKAMTTDGIVLSDYHYILPGGPYSRSYSSNGWFKDEEIIIKWGGDIENDTIVFSGGWNEYGAPRVSHIAINGKELEKDESLGEDSHFIYRKDMPIKK